MAIADRHKGRPPDVDYWFARKLGAPNLFLGTTDENIRRDRIREEILRRGCADDRLGKNRRLGEEETFRQAFERIYDCNL